MGLSAVRTTMGMESFDDLTDDELIFELPEKDVVRHGWRRWNGRLADLRFELDELSDDWKVEIDENDVEADGRPELDQLYCLKFVV